MDGTTKKLYALPGFFGDTEGIGLFDLQDAPVTRAEYVSYLEAAGFDIADAETIADGKTIEFQIPPSFDINRTAKRKAEVVITPDKASTMFWFDRLETETWDQEKTTLDAVESTRTSA